jgi:hypothetical protein
VLPSCLDICSTSQPTHRGLHPFGSAQRRCIIATHSRYIPGQDNSYWLSFCLPLPSDYSSSPACLSVASAARRQPVHPQYLGRLDGTVDGAEDLHPATVRAFIGKACPAVIVLHAIQFRLHLEGRVYCRGLGQASPARVRSAWQISLPA